MISRFKIIVIVLFTFQNVITSQEVCTSGADLPAVNSYNQLSIRSQNAILEIPVVIHVVGDIDMLNSVDESELIGFVDYCNTVLSGSNSSLINVRSEYESNIGVANINLIIEDIIFQNTEARFFRDPFFSSDNNLEDAKKSDAGGSNPLDTDRYLNIWICKIYEPDGSINNFTLGYGTAPIGAPGWNNTDKIQGILLNKKVVDAERSLVLLHELGHYFGLRHIVEFQQKFCEDTDGISDTPMGKVSPSCEYNDTCSGDNGPDMTENFMNPQAFHCRYMFTKGQVDVMRSIIKDYRPFLYREIPTDPIEPLSEIKIYPNFVTDIFTTEFIDCNVKFIDVDIYNSSGIQMHSDRFSAIRYKTFDVSAYDNGFYFIRIQHGDEVTVRRFVKI